MKKMVFIGDILDDGYTTYLGLLAQLGDRPSIQLGDFGCGFPGSKLPKRLPPQHRFIRGNHDNPAACLRHPNYLGHYGYLEELDLFYLGGAASIDKATRIEGSTWWPDEEIGMLAGYDALDLYQAKRPLVVVTHDCPGSVKWQLMEALGTRSFSGPSRTEQVLETMLGVHRPNLWIFGHYHKTVEFEYGGTRFVCIGLGEYKEFPWF